MSMNVPFWIALIGIAVPVYAYVGYPMVLFAVAVLVQVGRDVRYLVSRNERRQRAALQPIVSIILAAHNEEAVIEHTIQNLLDLEYPRDKFEIIVGSDASSDRTVELLQAFDGARVRALRFKERRGKLAVITDCAHAAKGSILVLSDANTILDRKAVATLVRHFECPYVGAVCGELQLTNGAGGPVAEGTYWRYEKTLKLLESRVDSALGANGAIYAIRKELFPTLPPHLITDDFVVPMRVRAKGFSVRYDPEAIATEEAPAGVSNEFRRRLRIGAGNWQALWQCAELLLPWKGFVAISFWSHKVLRWLTPFLLIPALVANGFLLSSQFWLALFILQLLFYAGAATGYLLRRLGLPTGACGTMAYFLTINVALGLGFVRGMFGLQGAIWKPTTRDTPRSGAQA